MANNESILTGAMMRAEFLHVAKLVHEATGMVCDAKRSHRVGGIWHCQDAKGTELCECDPKAGSVLLTETDADVPPLPLLDRIRDLRRAGLSTAALLDWLGTPQPPDPAREAAACFRVARCHLDAANLPPLHLLPVAKWPPRR
ncbi:MAG TPA: hypothetical protein VMF03_17795 [Steroidobacteraceae bacterium]|nr:hypothetical protein [Steroidobacteraceae bacterium]